MLFRSKEPGIVWLVIDEQEPTSQTADRVVEQIEQFMAALGTVRALPV